MKRRVYDYNVCVFNLKIIKGRITIITIIVVIVQFTFITVVFRQLVRIYSEGYVTQ